MTTYSDAIFAGWAIIGNVKAILLRLAFQCDVSIYTSVEVGLVGRRVSFTVRGTSENVARFKRLVRQISVT
jgi:hypothetical protein